MCAKWFCSFVLRCTSLPTCSSTTTNVACTRTMTTGWSNWPRINRSTSTTTTALARFWPGLCTEHSPGRNVQEQRRRAYETERNPFLIAHYEAAKWSWQLPTDASILAHGSRSWAQPYQLALEFDGRSRKRVLVRSLGIAKTL